MSSIRLLDLTTNFVLPFGQAWPVVVHHIFQRAHRGDISALPSFDVTKMAEEHDAIVVRMVEDHSAVVAKMTEKKEVKVKDVKDAAVKVKEEHEAAITAANKESEARVADMEAAATRAKEEHEAVITKVNEENSQLQKDLKAKMDTNMVLRHISPPSDISTATFRTDGFSPPMG